MCAVIRWVGLTLILAVALPAFAADAKDDAKKKKDKEPAKKAKKPAKKKDEDNAEPKEKPKKVVIEKTFDPKKILNFVNNPKFSQVEQRRELDMLDKLEKIRAQEMLKQFKQEMGMEAPASTPEAAKTLGSREGVK